MITHLCDLKKRLCTIIFTSSVVSVLGLQSCDKVELSESVYTIKLKFIGCGLHELPIYASAIGKSGNPETAHLLI